MIVELRWRSAGACHRDARVLPEWGAEALAGTGLPTPGPGREASLTIEPGAWVPQADPALVRVVPPEALSPGRTRRPDPRPGLHLPAHLVEGAPSGAHFLARCLGPAEGGWRLDFNHPLAGRRLEVSVREAPPGVAPATASDARTLLLDTGPGLQALRGDCEPAFGAHDHRRDDETPDAGFYARPRFVQHVDARARAEIACVYADVVPRRARLLDLMSSWVSHLPGSLDLARVEGVGMNAEELAANPRLDAWRVQDLNEDACLRFPDASFDAAVCTVSIEYLVRPVETLREVARVLAPGGVLALTFSNRWFPPKAVRIWSRLHDYERMWLVASWVAASGCFEDLETRSMVGHPRPPDDPYADRVATADPVFAVCARRGEAQVPPGGGCSSTVTCVA